MFTGWTADFADPAGTAVGLTDYVNEAARARRPGYRAKKSHLAAESRGFVRTLEPCP